MLKPNSNAGDVEYTQKPFFYLKNYDSDEANQIKCCRVSGSILAVGTSLGRIYVYDLENNILLE